jgi:hypothetical protein
MIDQPGNLVDPAEGGHHERFRAFGYGARRRSEDGTAEGGASVMRFVFSGLVETTAVFLTLCWIIVWERLNPPKADVRLKAPGRSRPFHR